MKMGALDRNRERRAARNREAAHPGMLDRGRVYREITTLAAKHPAYAEALRELARRLGWGLDLVDSDVAALLAAKRGAKK